MLTCTKSYRDIPFAHRQHKHDGHCAFIHGHNWSITLTFACNQTDESGFVVDFGKLKDIKNWIDQHLDHACLFNEDDPLLKSLISEHNGLFKPYVLPNCSSEGIAQHLYTIFEPMIHTLTHRRAWITSIEVQEDSKNSARYQPRPL